MTRWLIHHGHALLLAAKHIARQPVATLVSALVIGAVLALPATLALLVRDVQHVLSRFDSEPRLTLFLTAEASNDDVSKLEARLKSHAAVAAFSFISKEVALEQLKKELGDVAAGLERNPLPHAFAVRTKQANRDQIEALRNEASAWPKVERAVFDFEWAQRLSQLTRFGAQLIAALALITAAILLAVTLNTTRLQLASARDEIEVATLIGATRAWVRRPYLYVGLIQGLLAGLVALALIALAIAWLNPQLTLLVPFLGEGFRVLPPTASQALAGVAVVGALGLVGSAIAVAGHRIKLRS